MSHDAGREGLFLTELLLNLLLFTLCATACVGLLADAHSASRESSDLTRAVYLAQSAAERWRAGALSGPDWQEGAALGDPAYTLTLVEETGDGLRTARITVRGGDPAREVFALTVTAALEVGGP